MKKLTTILFVLIFLLSFVGCTAVQPQTTTPPLQSNNPSVSTTIAEPIIPLRMTLKILVANDPHLVDFRNYEQYYAWELFAQMCADRKLTVEWIVVDKEQYAATLMDYLAGDPAEMPDAFWCTEDVLSTEQRVLLASTGRLYPLEHILEYSDGTASSWYEAHPAVQSAKAYNGKTWWVSEYQEVIWNGDSLQPGQCLPKGVTFRLDWYNQLVQYGAWDAAKGYPDTAQELGQFLELCNAYDVNRSGQRDEYYLSYISDMHSTGLGNLFGVPRSAFAPNLVTGSVDTAWTQPGSRELMELLIDWYNKGYFPKDLVDSSNNTTGNRTYKYRSGNKVAVYNAYFSDNWSMDHTEIPNGAAPAVLCGVLPDTTVHPDAYIAMDAALSMDKSSLCFTDNLSHPATAAALLDVICSDDYATMIKWGTDISLEGVAVEEHTGQFRPITPFLTGAELFGHYALPTVSNVYDLAADEKLCLSDPSGEMHRVFLEAMTQWTPTYPDQIDDFLAIPTPEESMALSVYEPAFQELSQKLFYELVNGQISMDDWDACIDRLRTEGHMDQIQAIYQARFDRYLGK